MLLVGACNRHGIEVGADDALLGLAFLTSAISRMGGAAETRQESRARRGIGQPPAQCGFRSFGLCSRDFFALRGDDLVENRGHGVHISPSPFGREGRGGGPSISHPHLILSRRERGQTCYSFLPTMRTKSTVRQE